MPSASVLSRQSTTQPFEPQPQETLLNYDSLTLLSALKQSYEKGSNVDKIIQNSIELLTKSAVEINDWAGEERIRRQRKIARLRKNDETEPEEEKQDFESFQAKVRALTEEMDKSIQSVIDDCTWAEGIPSLIDKVAWKTREANAYGQVRQERRTSNENEDSDSEDDEEEENSDLLMRRPDPAKTLSSLLDAEQLTAETNWKSKSLTDRYARHEQYSLFYRLLHDAKNPGDSRPPCPNESLWFAETSSSRIPGASQRQGRSTQRSEADAVSDSDVAMEEGDTELEISHEVTRTTCPLTLLPFKDPVTSKKCPHSFERSAILDLIHRSTRYAPFTPDQTAELNRIRSQVERKRREAQLGTKIARCPECEAQLSENDLRADPVLLRRVNRALEARRQQQEREARDNHGAADSDSDEEEAARGTQRRKIVQLGSSPVRDVGKMNNRRRTLVKGERHSSIVPDSQS